MSLDLPLIWAGLIAVGVLMYVLLDGFDLGIGILFPFTRSRGDRDVMMNTVAPVWDGNETWLVLGGGGLLAAFPMAYSVVMPALYLPVLLMLAGLILRGVAFEFRFRGGLRGRPFWTVMFAAGSILATVAQGLILGGFLGATWLMLKTTDELHGDARRWSLVLGVLTAGFLLAVSLATLLLHPRIALRWGWSGTLDVDHFLGLSPIPVIGAAGLILVLWRAARRDHVWPFLGALLLFLSGYLGLAVSFAPYVAPYALDFRVAAAPDNALGLMLVGAAVALPLILGYTAWVYWVFRGKVDAHAGYHD
jgi:cytochrome d ubiquinol oxidase subunit II